MPGRPPVGGDQPLRQDVQRQVAHFVPLPFDAQMRHPVPLVDVPDLQGAQFLAADAMIEQRRQDGAVALALQRCSGGASRSIRAW